MKQREPRHRVAIKARMRTPAGWSDVVVRNVSKHGMLLRADPPPPAGSYIEVRRNRLVMVARAIWRDGDLFAVRTQDEIDIAALRDDTTAPRRVDGVEVERRRPRPDPAAEAERARQWGRRFQSLALGAAVVVAALLLVSGVVDVFATPLGRVTHALRGHPDP